MKRLEDTVQLRGIGKPVTATLIERQGSVCLYERSDEVYEVFIVKEAEAGEIFGKFHPKREVYPNNEDFGQTAWCYQNLEKARKKYIRLTDVYKV